MMWCVNPYQEAVDVYHSGVSVQMSDTLPNLMRKAEIFEEGAKAMLAAQRESGIKCLCGANGFFALDGTNAAWNLADRFDGKHGTLVFIPEERKGGN